MPFSPPKPIEEIIAQCVANVSQRILPDLTTANPNILALSFMYGHPLEIKNRLKDMTNGKLATKKLKFPVVMLFADVVGGKSSVKHSYNDVNLNIIIAMSSTNTYTAAQRIATNFAPILRPIYQELIQELFRCGYFWIQSPRQILGNEIERLYWGTSGIQGNTANEFDDYIDAIEIKNMRLTQSKAGTTLTKNTFMSLVEYFLSQTRATITVSTVTGNAITNAFFSNAITEITTETQDYIAGVDFTQDITTGTITGITIEFYQGQTIIAKR